MSIENINDQFHRYLFSRHFLPYLKKDRKHFPYFANSIIQIASPIPPHNILYKPLTIFMLLYSFPDQKYFAAGSK